MNLIITEQGGSIICALYDDKRMVQVDRISSSDKPAAGSVYLGKVKNIVPNINAAFIDIGIGELCFMQLSERIGKAPAYKRGGELVKLCREDEVVVQYVREGIKTKQPVVSTDITLTGRYIIKTSKNEVSISSKIKDKQRRKELTGWLTDNNIVTVSCDNSDNSGYIVRTNAVSVSKEKLLCEKEYLDSIYNDISKKAGHAAVFSCLYHAPDELISIVRDGYISEVDRIITDDMSIYNKLEEYGKETGAELLTKLEYYKDTYSLSALYALEANLKNALNKKVWLKSGAYLIIEPTEACTVIDINSGKAIAGKKNKEDTIYKINIEAAHEITRQLRLRNISGMIIADFIDMESKEHQDMLISRLKELVSTDPVKTTVVDITKLGLVEMTRKKVKKSVYEQWQLLINM